MLRDYCAQRGISLIIVGIPTVFQVTTDEEPVTPLTQIGRRLAVPTVDLLRSFKQETPAVRNELYFPKDQHWTAEGHDVAARIVAAELRQRGLVPGPSSR